MQIQVVFLALVGAALAAPPVYHADYFAHPKYSYSYGVKDALTGDQKSAMETRDGDVVKGSYSLVQPDGVLRTVNYVATPLGGFQAQVINSAPGVHAVEKKVAAAPIAPIAHTHGYGGHIGHGGYGAPVVAKAVAPVAVAYSKSLNAHHHGYGGHVGPIAHGYGGGYGGYGAIGHGAYGHGAIGHGAIGHGAYGHGAIGGYGAGAYGYAGVPAYGYGGYGGHVGHVGHAGHVGHVGHAGLHHGGIY